MNIDIEACYKKYAPMVFRRCSVLLKNGDEALDAVQDVFVNLLRYRKRLKGQFLSSLLYTIATNICLNRLRRRKFTADNCGSDFVAPSMACDPQYEKVEDSMLVDAILQNESESTRAICFMYHTDGMTLQEIGEALGMSISGVRKRLLAFSARAKIRLGGELL
ncbi:MAG: sigma-70 family RNA polymerase sigma factor [Treponema sp.]|nr:sigma-70 family RNA polymerase sigma factor [Treponema sp.]MCL2273164.1 sigma-70 family RNA polymerase sigma factor [Treponema sp.]